MATTLTVMAAVQHAKLKSVSNAFTQQQLQMFVPKFEETAEESDRLAEMMVTHSTVTAVARLVTLSLGLLDLGARQ